jgi:hypothetical protein
MKARCVPVSISHVFINRMVGELWLWWCFSAGCSLLPVNWQLDLPLKASFGAAV